MLQCALHSDVKTIRQCLHALSSGSIPMASLMYFLVAYGDLCPDVPKHMHPTQTAPLDTLQNVAQP